MGEKKKKTEATMAAVAAEKGGGAHLSLEDDLSGEKKKGSGFLQ